MRSFKILCIFLVSSFLVFSCASTKKTYKKPPVKIHDLTLSKGVEKQATTALPKEPATSFSTEDPEVVALMHFENLSGKPKIRWDWHDPNGDLYLSSGNYPLKISEGKYLKEAAAWHSLVLKGDDAANLPGKWEVKVYINDELSDLKPFTLKAEKKVESLSGGVIPKPFPKDWGLIIGIQNYAHLPEVQFAQKDALIMKEYFIRVLRVPEENIIMLIDSDATKGRIQGYLENYIPSNVTRETTLYVYFAGHGAPDLDSGDPYLVPYDGDTLFIEQTAYKLRKFYSDLENLKIRQTYVFLDSCFSGSASRAAEMLTQGTRPALLNVKDVKFTTDTIVSLSASSKGQTSNAYPEKEHGLFTYYLLKALSGEADADDDQWISIKEVYQYVLQKVNQISRRLGSEQNPSILPPLEMIKDSAIGRVIE
jgi:hypothetical protein